LKLAAALFSTFFLSTVASAQDARCLRQNMVLGWDVVNDRTLVVTDRTQHRFKVSLAPGCFNLKFHLALSFRSFARTGLACLGHNDFVLVPPQGGEVAQRCLIAKVEPYVSAIPPK
jgi:hypothetical protein